MNINIIKLLKSSASIRSKLSEIFSHIQHSVFDIQRSFRKSRRKRLVALGGVFLILFSIIFITFLIRPKEVKAWWDDNWINRVKITFGNIGSAVTDRKVKFDIDTASLIAAGKMQSDCGDSRFVTENGEILRYYLDSAGGDCNTASTDYYVLFPNIFSGTNVIYHYYGNSQAVNGTETAQFSQSTFSPTSGPTTGSEEKTPGPVAYWKFDEGYDNYPRTTVLPTHETQINLINTTYRFIGSGYRPKDNSLGLFHWDANKYPNATAVYFEAVGLSSWGNAYFALFKSDTTTQVTNSQISIGETAKAERTGNILPYLTTNTDYSVQVSHVVTDRYAYLYSARIIIVQGQNVLIPKTETTVDLGIKTKISSNSYAPLDQKRAYYFDSSKFNPVPEARLEASLRSSQPTIEQEINFTNKTFSQLGTSWAPTDYSLGVIKWDGSKYSSKKVYLEVSANVTQGEGIVGIYNTSNEQVYTLTIGQPINNTRSVDLSSTLQDGVSYTIRIRHAYWDDRTINLYSAKLIIVQSDTTKITDTRTQINIGSNQTNFADTTATLQTNPKYFIYDQNLFSPTPESSGDVSFHTTVKINDSADTVNVELYNTGGAVVASVSHTGDTTWTQKSSTNVDSDSDWDTTNDDTYTIRVYCTDNNGGGCSGNIANAYLYLDQSDSGGITDLEIRHELINTLATDTDVNFSLNPQFYLFNHEINNNDSYGGGSFSYYHEAVMKTTGGTGNIRLYNYVYGSTFTSTILSTTNTNYELLRSSEISSSLQPTYYNNRLREGINNSGASTTSVSTSSLIVNVSDLTTTGPPTASAELYNTTTNSSVAGSEITTASNSWTLTRSSSTFSLDTNSEYVLRIKSSTSNQAVYIANAHLLLEQNDDNGITTTETVQQYISYPVSVASGTHADMIFNNHFNKSNFNTYSTYFEAMLKVQSGGTGYAILENDETTNQINDPTNSELSTTGTSYTRYRSGELSNNTDWPATEQEMDTQMKSNSSSYTTYASSSWLIVQNTLIKVPYSNDHTGHNRRAYIFGPSWKVEPVCKWGNCLEFDGNDDYIIAVDSPNLDIGTDSYTITTWFKHVAKTSGTDVLIAKFNSSTGSDGGYKIQMESDGDLTFAIDDDATSFPEDSVTSSAATYDDNSWHHLAAVKNGATSITLYIDGQIVGTDDAILSSGTLANTDPLYIGVDGNGSSNPFKGVVDEVKFYPYARTASEIKNDYTGGTALLGIKNESPLENGLVGYWKMEEAANSSRSDSSGNNNTLTESTEDDIDTGVGKFGNSGNFESANAEYLSITDANQIGLDITENISVCTWVNFKSFDANQWFLTKYDDSNSQRAYAMMANTNGKVVLYISSDGGNVNFKTNSTDSVLSINNWYHVCGTYDGQQMNIYLNGKLDSDPTSFSLGIFNSSANFNIGANSYGGYPLNGYIDEARVYNRTLSPGEVQSLYNWAPGPVGYWKLDENQGSSAYDSSGNGNNSSSFTGNPTWVTGKFGSGLDFPGGTSTGVVINDSASLHLSDFTLETWVKANVNNVTQGLIAKRNEYSTLDWQFFLGSNGLVNLLVGDTVKDSVLTECPYTTGSWTHLAVTKNGNLYTLYKNGVYCQSNTSSVTWTESENVRLGDINGASLNGTLDEAKIYNYARTPAQIIEDMNAGHPAPGSPIGSAVGEWKFDEGYGDTANNSGNGGTSLNGNLGGSGNTCPGVDAECPAWTSSGKFDKAIYINNGGDNVNIGDVGFVDAASNLTVSFWLNITTLTASRSIIGKWPLTNNSNSFAVVSNTINNDELNFYIPAGTADASTRFITSNLDLTTGSWQHIVMVYNGTETATNRLKVYKNAQAILGSISGTIPASLTSGTTSELIIGDIKNSNSALNTYIDEVSIFTSSLTPDQIKLLFNQGQAAVMGAASTASSSATINSSTRSYCPPGDTGTCNPPVAEWKLDENTGVSTYDTSGNSNASTTWTGNPSWVRGKNGSGLNFGADSVVRFAETSSTNVDSYTDSFTISGWFRTSFDHTVETGFVVACKHDSSGSFPFCLFITTEEKARFHNGIDWPSGSTALNDGKWHYLVGVNDVGSDTVSLYVDGQLANRVAHTVSTSRVNDDDISIGNAGTSYTQFDLVGDVDDVKLYNYARTPAQIAWDYNRGAPLAWYKFDECTGTTAYNLAPAASGGAPGMNGTITPGSSGNTSAGSCNSGVPTEMWNDGTNGKYAGSLGFDDIDDYVSLGNNAFGNLDDYHSISAWIKPDGYNGTIISEYDGGGEGCGDATFNIDYNKISFHNGQDLTITGNRIVYDNQWHHVVFVSDENNSYLYVDGKLDKTGTDVNWNNSCTGQDVRIGARQTVGGEDVFNGQIDEVKIFNYALSPEQVKIEYNQGSAVNFR